jgi:hypothetical protein
MGNMYLELVLASLRRGGWVEEINCENLFRQHHVSFSIQKSFNPATLRLSNILIISRTFISSWIMLQCNPLIF